MKEAIRLDQSMPEIEPIAISDYLGIMFPPHLLAKPKK